MVTDGTGLLHTPPLATARPAQDTQGGTRASGVVAWWRARGEYGVLRNLIVLLEVRVVDAKLSLEALPQLLPLNVRPWSHLLVHDVTLRPDLSAGEVHRLGACG